MVLFLFPFSLFAFLLVLMVGGIVQVQQYYTIVPIIHTVSYLVFAYNSWHSLHAMTPFYAHTQ